MRRILYLDPFCPPGHVNFNRRYLRALRDAGCEVDVAVSAPYFEAIGVDCRLRVAVPGSLCREGAGRLESRVAQAIMLWWVRWKTRRERYTAWFFASYEELATAVAGPRRPCVFVAHNNVARLANPVRLSLAQRLARRGPLVVFHESIRARANELGLTNVEVIAHGLPEPYSIGHHHTRRLALLDARLTSEDYRHVVFVTSSEKFSDRSFHELVLDPRIRAFLRRRQVLLVVRSARLQIEDSSLVFVRGYLSREDYESLFLRSSCAVVHYPASFAYRVSGTLFECFSNQKPCLVHDIPSMRAFDRHFTYPAFYRSADQFVCLLSQLLDRVESDDMWQPYLQVQDLEPSFDELINRQGW